MKKIMEKYREKLRSKRKGVTPVIAIVLLLMMTVAAAGMAYVFIQQVQTDAQTTAGDAVTKTAKDVSASISIESVWEDSGISFVIRNSGTYVYTAADLGNLDVYIDGAPATITSGCSGLGAAGTTCTVVTSDTFPTAVGVPTVIKVSPPVGNEVTYSCVIKSSTDTYC